MIQSNHRAKAVEIAERPDSGRIVVFRRGPRADARPRTPPRRPGLSHGPGAPVCCVAHNHWKCRPCMKMTNPGQKRPPSTQIVWCHGVIVRAAAPCATTSLAQRQCAVPLKTSLAQKAIAGPAPRRPGGGDSTRVPRAWGISSRDHRHEFASGRRPSKTPQSSLNSNMLARCRPIPNPPPQLRQASLA